MLPRVHEALAGRFWATGMMLEGQMHYSYLLHRQLLGTHALGI